MNKRIFAFFLTLLFSFTVALPTLAAADNAYIYDETGEISTEDVKILNDNAKKLYENTGLYVFFIQYKAVSDKKLYDQAKEYYYEKVGGKDGAEKDGVVLVEDPDEWLIATFGRADHLISEQAANDMWDVYNDKRGKAGVDAFHSYVAKIAQKDAPKDSPANGIPAERQKPRLVDDASLLNEDDRASLLAKLDEISERQQVDVAVVTVETLGNKTSQAYADDFYDYNGYGMGEGDDGILLLICPEERDWAITTYGSAIPTFTDAGQAYMVEQFKPDLSDGDFATAFNKYADLCDKFITKAKDGKPYDTGNLPKKSKMPFKDTVYPFLSLFLGIFAGFLITRKMKLQLKSVVSKDSAADYQKPGSLQLTNTQDIFLYSKLDKRKIEKKDSGSSTHSSSSGRDHGGSSGKF